MKTIIITAVTLLCSGSVYSLPTAADSSDTVDKIAVIVGDQVILASELANQLQLAAFQSGQRPRTEEEIRRFQKQVLEQMVSDQLFLAESQEGYNHHGQADRGAAGAGRSHCPGR